MHSVENIAQEPKIYCIFGPSTRTWCYVVADNATGHAVIIDPVLSRSTTRAISTAAPDAVLAIIHENNYTVDHILETNAYEDYPSAVWYLRTRLLETCGQAPRIVVRKSLKVVGRLYAQKYNTHNRFWAEQFDGNFMDGEVLGTGSLKIRVVHLPGLSLNHVGYVIANNIFMGDCCFHTPHHRELDEITKEYLRKSIKKIQNMPATIRISTTRGCLVKPGELGCVGESREQHAVAGYAPRRPSRDAMSKASHLTRSCEIGLHRIDNSMDCVAGVLDDGLIV